MTGFRVDPDELRARSTDLADAADGIRALEPALTAALDVSDLLASALLSPATALELGDALHHVLTNPAGLALEHPGLAEQLAADALALRIAALTYEHPDLAASETLADLTAQLADGAQLDAARTLTTADPTALAPVAPELVALHALLDENPGNDRLGWDVVRGERPTVDPVLGVGLAGLPGPLDPAGGRATRAGRPGPAARELLGHRAGLDVQLATLAELRNDGRIAVHTVRGADGGQRWVVQLPGMRWGEPVTGSPQDLAGAVAATTTGESAYGAAVRDAMEQAGVPRGADVLLVGHSAGGAVALNLAGDPSFNGDAYVVTDVVAVGAPVDHKPVPEGTSVVSVTNERDVVPTLDGVGPASPERNPAGHAEVRVDSGPVDLRTAHTLATYRELLGAPGPDGTAPGVGIDARLAPYTGGTVTDVQVFQLHDGDRR